MTFRARVAAATVVAGLVAAAPAAAAPPVQPGQRGFPHRPVCGPPKAAHARCHAEVVTKADGVTPLATDTYSSGYRPADLVSAYNLPPSAPPNPGSGPTIAIVDAYDLPTAQNDLNVYRGQFGLGGCASGCFTKVGQTGSTTQLPAADAGWGQEIALDIEMASAVCPDCRILLVEANSASIADLGAAVDTAFALGARVISNSYGTREFASETAYDVHFRHAGTAITVSSGDAGYGVEWPASSQYVTAVGGTTLRAATTGTRRWTESAWSGAGSGCSAVEPKPAWQTAATGCSKRAVADVAAVADPNTGVAVYDSTAFQSSAGWMVFGGTSVAAPVIAGVYALAGNAGSTDYPARYPWAPGASLYDVTIGSNGRCAKKSAKWCSGGAGWDGPTGLGTPNGITAF